MKKAIVEALTAKGPLTAKKAKKATLKLLAEEYKDKEDDFEATFTSTLESLVKKQKLVKDEDTYSVNAEHGGSKRKRSGEGEDGGEDGGEDKEAEAPAEVEEKPKKTKKPKSDKGKVEVVGGFVPEELWKNGEKYWRENLFPHEYLTKNPEKVTRLFCGNLNKTITEEQLKEQLPGTTFIKWITDKQTGEFYGSSFLEMKDPEAAAMAVMQDKSKFLGRPLKLYYCPPRPGDKWPPHGGSGRGKPGPGGEQANQPPRREKTEKPEGCCKLFAGNLSYNIDDEAIVEFFKDCGTLVGLRWLTRVGTEEFRGAGYVEFGSSEEADKAMKQDGKELLGRNIRLDWTS
ncbi:hypothetical protein B484DRAFT_448494 [Ochromonadaceae sp. CCMP2298]|nr:hypothetical protein B484DRAFT_448494 [Ochromonadaceae sp. CCMP2298]|mmetsp:Transcript_4210/g.9444  ORF Transcript_4210/g.9444 Transcript_4210/m.9444 type:complete len:344 (+) Transcript_4210:44-1075(+)